MNPKHIWRELKEFWRVEYENALRFLTWDPREWIEASINALTEGVRALPYTIVHAWLLYQLIKQGIRLCS